MQFNARRGRRGYRSCLHDREPVGAGRFELPISCSQSRRASHYATPRGVPGSLGVAPLAARNRLEWPGIPGVAASVRRAQQACGCSSMAEPQPSKLAMPVRSRSPAPTQPDANGGRSQARAVRMKRRLCIPTGTGRTPSRRDTRVHDRRLIPQQPPMSRSIDLASHPGRALDRIEQHLGPTWTPIPRSRMARPRVAAIEPRASSGATRRLVAVDRLTSSRVYEVNRERGH
jgi:hypothetical protein